MKIAILGGANDIHTIRWANGLVNEGMEVHLISVHSLLHKLDDKVSFYQLPFKAPYSYFFSFFSLKIILKKIQPDILNAHYATGYGLLANLSGFKPLVLSVWGSDVYSFPLKSYFHKFVLKNNLKNATSIGSTSNIMAKEVTKTFIHPYIFVTPFGIDEKLFRPLAYKKDAGNIIIGTVKKLEEKYGIDLLIQAFFKAYSELTIEFPNYKGKIRLEIIGQGSQFKFLNNLVQEMGIEDLVQFRGFVPHERIPEFLAQFDVYVALSRFDSESFGVAILEANSCGIPVIVSDADGLKEVTINNETGYIVEKENVEQAAWALKKLVLDEKLREKMGAAGRKHVIENFTWEQSLSRMIKVYETTINIFKRKGS